jgi:hypothetical protein
VSQTVCTALVDCTSVLLALMCVGVLQRNARMQTNTADMYGLGSCWDLCWCAGCKQQASHAAALS